MIILGIDPGSRATGYGVITTEPVLRMVAGGVIRPAAEASLPQRLRAIHDGIAEVVKEHRPQQMAVEMVFNARNARSSLVLGHARGVALLAGALAEIPVAEYAPSVIKRAITGNGGASKVQVRAMVRRLLAHAGDFALDESDALAVAIAHAGRSGVGMRLRAGG
jgi:crossover junction endodeoxyribonuclease RuvC